MQTIEKQVALKDIDMHDRSFIVTAGRPTDELQRSIAESGLLNPPLLARIPGQTTYRIICGYRRLQALAGLSCREVAALIVTPDLPDSALLVCALNDNLAHRSFNAVEQAGAIVRLRNYFPDEAVLREWLPRLGLHSSMRAIRQAEALAGLEPDICAGLLAGTIAEKGVLPLSRMAEKDRMALFNLFIRVNLSASKQVEIIENCLDIARRDECGICDSIGDGYVQEVLENDTYTASQRGELIRQYIRRKRFPPPGTAGTAVRQGEKRAAPAPRCDPALSGQL